ncbi:unannotated protein [freshwater metagenome]|uniref:Unannotated protein n=1 Tax=freshwater metagenome TaxID=449393 RepID=A0A6J6JDP0_9ZZZZ
MASALRTAGQVNAARMIPPTPIVNDPIANVETSADMPAATTPVVPHIRHETTRASRAELDIYPSVRAIAATRAGNRG